MTPQEIFDKAARHLLTQGVKCVDSDGICKYRGDEGTACAVGCLIPDELYDQGIEGVSVSYMACFDNKEQELIFSLLASGVDLSDRLVRNLVSELQDCHDAFFVDEWRDHLRRIACVHGLSARALDESA